MRMRFVCLTMLVLAVVSISAAPRRNSKVRKVTPKPAVGRPLFKPGFFDVVQTTTPFSQLDIDWGLNLDPPTQALYQQMVNAVQNGVVAIPDDRWNYYSDVSNPPGCTITSWNALVADVAQQLDGSYIVTVTVDPGVVLANGGTNLMIGSDYQEQYRVDANNNVTYTGFLDPAGWAGNSPFTVHP